MDPLVLIPSLSVLQNTFVVLTEPTNTPIVILCKLFLVKPPRVLLEVTSKSLNKLNIQLEKETHKLLILETDLSRDVPDSKELLVKKMLTTM